MGRSSRKKGFAIKTVTNTICRTRSGNVIKTGRTADRVTKRRRNEIDIGGHDSPASVRVAYNDKDEVTVRGKRLKCIDIKVDPHAATVGVSAAKATGRGGSQTKRLTVRAGGNANNKPIANEPMVLRPRKPTPAQKVPVISTSTLKKRLPNRTKTKISKPSKKFATKLKSASSISIVSVGIGKKRKKEAKTKPVATTSKSKRPRRGQLVPNLNVTEYLVDPTFEQALPIPHISAMFQSKLLIRAILLNDMNLLERLTKDTMSISSYCVPRCLTINRTALSYAIESGNIDAMQILLKNPVTENFAPVKPWLIIEEQTGHGSKFQFGHALRNVTVGRGGKEGNAALLKDRSILYSTRIERFSGHHWKEALEFGLPLPILEKMKPFNLTNINEFPFETLSMIVSAVRKGHNTLSAQLIELALAKGGFGFNKLHMEALTKCKSDPLTPFKFQSVSKKALMNSRFTPLHCAAINPDSYCLSTLLNMSPNYTIQDDDEWMLVHYAAACTGSAPIEFLISRRVSTNQVNKEGQTPAHIAAELGRAKNLELILKSEAEISSSSLIDVDEEEDDVDPQPKKSKRKKKLATDAFSAIRLSKKGYTPLHAACAAGKVECVKALLDSPLVDKDKPTPAQFDKLTPLMIAAGYGHLDVVQHLVTVGAKLKVKDRRCKIALAHAVINGHAHIVSYLLRLGDNHLAKDSSGNTLIHFACAYAWNFNLKLLMEAGCCPNEPNLWKLTPLAIAFCKGHMGIVEILLKEPGVNINAPIDSKGWTLLLQTVSAEQSEDMMARVKYLIDEQKADCTITDFKGNNAIHCLVTRKCKIRSNFTYSQDSTRETLNFLVKSGLSLDDRNAKGETPISIAASNGCIDLVEILFQVGGTISAEPNGEGNTLLHLLADRLPGTPSDVSKFYTNCSAEPKAFTAMKLMAQTFNASGMTPLHRILNRCSGSSEIGRLHVTDYVSFLVNKLDSDVNAIIKDDIKSQPLRESVLHLAADHYLANALLQIILPKKPFLDPVNAAGRTPLAKAILKRDVNVTRILVVEGADMNFKSVNDGGKSIILLEVSQPSSDFLLVPLFISKGAVVKDIVEEASGNSVLHFVAKNPTAAGAVLAIKALIAAGVKVNAENKLLRTSLHLAVSSRCGEVDSNYEVEKVLFQEGANLCARDISGRIPLHYAFLKVGDGKKNMATNLLDPIELVTIITNAMKESNCSNDIETADKYGQTPLHAAAIRGATISASHLLGESTNPIALLNLTDKKGNTPLAHAVLNSHDGCALMLLQAGSDFVMELNTGGSKLLLDKNTESWIWNPVYREILLLDNEASRSARRSILEEIVRKDWQGLLYLMIQKLNVTGSGVIPGIEAAVRVRRFKLANKLVDYVKANTLQVQDKSSLLHVLAQNGTAQFDTTLQLQLLESLVHKNFELKGLDSHKSIPLIYAAINRNIHLCSEFTRMMRMTASEISKMAPDSFGRTPFSALFWNPILPDDEFPANLRAWGESVLENGNVRCKYPIEISSYPGIRYIRKDDDSFYDERSIDRSCMIPEYTPLIMAVIYGNLKVVAWLLRLREKIDINFTDSSGRTPLMHAIRLNDIRMVKLLLNPNYNFEYDKYSWNVECRLESISDEIDLNVIDNEGFSIIHHLVSPIPTSSSLVYARADKILKILEGTGAPWDIKSSQFDETPLQMASRQMKYPIASVLAGIIGYDTTSTTLELNSTIVEPANEICPIEDVISGSISITAAEEDAKRMIDKLKTNLERVNVNVVEPDPLSNLTTENSIILVDPEFNIPFDCLLNMVDLTYGEFGMYNYYKMQLIKQTKGPELILLFTRWGRMGDTGQYQKTPFPNEAEAMDEFKKIFKSKSGNTWNNFTTTSFVPQAKKYRIVNVDRSKMNIVSPEFGRIVKVDFNLLESEVMAQCTELTENVYQLMHKLCFEHRSKGISGYGQNNLAFGQIDYNSFKKAEEILDQIQTWLNKKGAKTQGHDVSETDSPSVESVILELSEAYFTLIPIHGYAFEKISPISEKDIRKHQQLIRNFLHGEFAFQILLAAQWNQPNMNPLDYVYATIGAKLQTLDKSSEEAQLILEYIYTTDHDKPFVDNIYRVQVPGGVERITSLNIGNRHLLWHGTHTCNLISILHRGLQIAPLGYNFNGSLYGKGIYFSDTFMKSRQYCNTLTPGQPKFAILCEVALGNVQDVVSGVGLSQNGAILRDGYHSLKASNSRWSSHYPERSENSDVYWKGRRIPLAHSQPRNNNEYVVFNTHQANIMYIVQFHGTFPKIKMENLF